MSKPVPLRAEDLCRLCDPKRLPFETTDELKELTDIIGQDRAMEALQFGLGMEGPDFNIYALGPSGLGKHLLVNKLVEARAANEAVPPDWCYVYNFEDHHRPKALSVPSGRGSQLKKDMEQLVEELRIAIPAAFETEEFRTRKQALEAASEKPHEEAIQKLQQKAEEKNIGLIRTPVGIALAPLVNGEALSPEDFEKRSNEEKERIKGDIQALEEELAAIIQQVPKWKREHRARMKKLIREVTAFAVETLIEELRFRYQGVESVQEYLRHVEAHIVDHADEFLAPDPDAEGPMSLMEVPDQPPKFWRYRVNVITDHNDSTGAPVVYEDHPTYDGLMGRLEHVSRMGTLMTDFSLIKAGALHRANGGYLIIDARKLLMQPFSWEALKRALYARELRLESVPGLLGMISTKSVEPEAIPLSLKVVLIGNRRIYYLLNQLDPDFSELFQVEADFDDEIDWTENGEELYARMIATTARSEHLKPLNRLAVGRVLEHAARTSDDSKKLSLHRRDLRNLLREANYFAKESGSALIDRDAVQRALDERIHRADRIKDRMFEQIQRGTVLLDVSGERVGQINALSVLELGGFRFGRPTRVSARTRLGKGRVVDIEREVELGGPIHSKGVLILESFLAARYAPDKPLSLAASLVFEQSYGGVEGDSASSAELYALLSSLSGLPIKQNFAVTGSVNQHGEVQAIGGVNEKIEGFFDVCKRLGFTGTQGVLIPKSNVEHLMLRQEVVQAVREGTFHIYPVSTIDEGIELLTGVSSGERGPDGLFEVGTVNGRVEARLDEFIEAAKKFTSSDEKSSEGSKK